MKNLIIIAVVILGGYQFYNKLSSDGFFLSSSNPNGFVQVMMPDDKRSGLVYIMAPENCPKDAGLRADALERELRRLRIPVARSSSGNISTPRTTADEEKRFKHAVRILRGEIPGVFINGMAKANPTIQEVVAQYSEPKPDN